MHTLSRFLTTLAATVIGTNALEASIFTFGTDVNTQELKPSVISSVTFLQLLDLRSKSSTASNLGRVDEEGVEFLSRLSGAPSPLFDTSTSGRDANTVLVFLEGIADTIDSSIRTEYQSELVTSALSTEPGIDTIFDSFLETRIRDMVSLGGKRCILRGPESVSFETQKNDLSCLRETLASQMFSRTLESGLLNLISIGEFWINEHKGTVVLRIIFEDPTNSKSPSTYISGLNSLFSDLRSIGAAGEMATAVLLPTSQTTRKSYSRRASEETNIDSKISSVRDARPVHLQQQAQVLLTLAPVCYESNSSCTEATSSCSGHGVCYKKYGSGGDCYACRCHETTVRNEDGTERLIRWGGSACQKKDVSSPFFLISGVTIAIVVIIGTAIGMIYSVGNVELPGVISAGVGAPRAQK
ncbi:hypothetical protein BJY01DRAFT_229956 [Aspergillus pseudoustus]|uniref:Vacuolar sorting protein Vps3844 C-terminal domain-containing protein n=1 Tax=Aspergillus pseudoustus TaxID=1810923 RepID=A0ABR4IFI5_9EURO